MNEIVYLNGKKSIEIILVGSVHSIIEINSGNININYSLVGYK